MSLPALDNNATIDASTVVLTASQRALFMTLRRVLISALKILDDLLK